jgi:hypothetical protein
MGAVGELDLNRPRVLRPCPRTDGQQGDEKCYPVGGQGDLLGVVRALCYPKREADTSRGTLRV